MSAIAIRAEQLSKQYRIGYKKASYQTFREALTAAVRAPVRWITGDKIQERNTIWALDDVSFEINHGEAVGIIGRNGSGKSTLLKILSRITRPTSGRAEIFGRVGSLLEVGTGFHPELTGRENIYLNGAILGMHRKEIDRKFDEIVAFSEIERFLDTPVKYYSSGMYVRLAFAVAAHLEPEILVVDEVLAVGDAEFQKKCLGKMGDVASEGRTVLFVSHNLRAVQNLCSRSILLLKGKIVTDGVTENVINTYLSSVIDSDVVPISQRRDRSGDGIFRFTELTFNGEKGNIINCGEKTDIVISCEVNGKIKNPDISIGFLDVAGIRAMHISNRVAGIPIPFLSANMKLVCSFKKFPLLPGKYILNLYCEVNGKIADYVKEAAIIDVGVGDYYDSGKLPPSGFGFTAVDQEWKIVNAK
jgi:lipopolysaccharide transport system ATP-binding protein